MSKYLEYIAPVAGAAIAGYAAYQLPISSMSSILAGGGYLVSKMYIDAKVMPAGGAGAIALNIAVGAAAAQYLGGEGLSMQEGVVLALGAYGGDLLAAKLSTDAMEY